ncbi:MAG TPA: hypothetical protein VGA84_06685 [Thermoanaerobaculia bacterium]
MMLNVAIDRPDARWLPSRHRFAVARLIGYILLRRARSTVQSPEHLILAIDRDQTAVEMHLAALWVFATTACYIAVSLPFALPLSIALAIPLAAITINLPIVLSGLILRGLTGDGNHIKIVSVITMALLLIASSYVATTRTWARFVAWLFFAILLLNCVAAVILWLLRGIVQAAEERCVR